MLLAEGGEAWRGGRGREDEVPFELERAMAEASSKAIAPREGSPGRRVLSQQEALIWRERRAAGG
jgi:hypothetical protein